MQADTADDLVRGEALATPRQRVETMLVNLISPAESALKAILLTDFKTIEKQPASAFAKVQLTAVIYTIDAIKGIAAESGKQTKKAAQILAAVGGDAINREIMRRYAAKQRNTERQRIVEAVPAEAHVKGESALDSNAHVKGEEDGITNDSVSHDTLTNDDTPPPDTTPGHP